MSRFFLSSVAIACALLRAGTVVAQSNYESYSFTTLAGVSPGTADGTGSAARFNFPAGMRVDSAGNIYVADRDNHIIRKVTAAGVVTTLAGLAGSPGSADGTGSAARFRTPEGAAVDTAGNVYVSDSLNHTIRKITPAGVVTTLAGLAGSSGSANGTGSVARFAFPGGLAVDSAGTLYVADRDNNTIRKVTPAGVVTTLAGLAGSFGSADGTGSNARFRGPNSVAVDPSGNSYVADAFNSTVRKITPGGVVSTLAGSAGISGSADGTGSTARFGLPFGVAVDGGGNVYVADTPSTIRKITPAGVVTTLAGLAGGRGAADGTGSVARFNFPFGVATDSSGNVYVGDAGNCTIRKITPAGVVTTLAGLYSPGSTDGAGSAARFFGPAGVALDSAGNGYVAEFGNNTIRKISPAGVVSTLAGSAGNPGNADGTGSAARFNFPFGVALDSAGAIYVGDSFNSTIRKISPAGLVSTFAGLAGNPGSTDGTGSTARFNNPGGVGVDSAGYVYVADSSNNTIRKITPAGLVSTLAGLAGSSGNADGTGSAARFSGPRGLAVDSAGTVYVVGGDFTNTIRKITPAGVVTTLAGLAGTPGSADGTGSDARFSSLRSVAIDAASNVYVGDAGNSTIRKITPAGLVTTLAGAVDSFSSRDGTGSIARFNRPEGVAADGAGNIYVADTANSTIRLGRPIPPGPSAATLPSGNLLFTGVAPPGSQVGISATSDLATAFGTISTVTADAGGTFQYEDVNTASYTKRFYRASIQASQPSQR